MTLQEFLNWGWDIQHASSQQLRRVRTLAAAGLMLVTVAFPFFVQSLVWWIPTRIILVGLAISCGVVALTLLRQRIYGVGVHAVALGVYIGGVNQALTLGGSLNGAVAWWLIAPLIGGLLLGARIGLLWVVFCALTALVFLALETNGVAFPNLTPVDARVGQLVMIVLGEFLALAVVMTAYLTQIESFERSLQRRNMELEQQVLRAEKAEQEALDASAAKTRFLANMSHELRTPLNSILGFTRRVLTKSEGVLEERQYNALETVAENGEQMLQLVTDLLDLSRIDAGRLELSRGLIDLREMLSLLVPKQRFLAERFGLELSVAPLPEAFCQGDVGQLQRALETLLRHALQYAPAGSVRISAALTADSMWECRVQCDQLVFSEDQFRRLFDPTDHLHSAIGRRVIVSGLALLLARELAEIHGGRLDLDSDSATGTIYRLALPIQ